MSVAIITTVFTTAICTSRHADDVMCSALNVDAVAADLQSCQLITTPPTDVESGINCYYIEKLHTVYLLLYKPML